MRDLTGRVFHCLTVVAVDRSINHTRWLCKCSCGRDAYAKTYDLLHNKKKSCGHLRTEHNKMYAERFIKNKKNLKMPNVVLRTGSVSGLSIDDSLDELLGMGW